MHSSLLLISAAAALALSGCATTLSHVAGYKAGDVMRFRAKQVVEKTEQAKICDQFKDGAITVAQCKERTLAVLEIEPKFTQLTRTEVVMLVPEPLAVGDVVQYKLAGMLHEVNGPEPEYQGVICRATDKPCLDDPKRGSTGKVDPGTGVAAGA
ncbi:hypothetical protein GPA27_01890 [Aromatoleum toluolicum]|uniref:Lipoprotein n=1 Tax=Aromatoleum toluolicum TaxID=90060 RepID=A0ABX1NA40_9RHOO|nr:hypothetical protein [Aromatoleum toluolicum]NMF96148.1 hypothetical protein [Aromatoleum toluolicum]